MYVLYPPVDGPTSMHTWTTHALNEVSGLRRGHEGYTYIHIYIYAGKTSLFINAMIYVENQKESPTLKVLRKK